MAPLNPGSADLLSGHADDPAALRREIALLRAQLLLRTQSLERLQTVLDRMPGAVAEAGPGAYDAVLCDIEMPVLDGFGATARMLAIDPGLPVIGLTAHAFEDARQRGQDSGMLDYLTKPVIFESLNACLLRHARRSGA